LELKAVETSSGCVVVLMAPLIIHLYVKHNPKVTGYSLILCLKYNLKVASLVSSSTVESGRVWGLSIWLPSWFLSSRLDWNGSWKGVVMLQDQLALQGPSPKVLCLGEERETDRGRNGKTTFRKGLLWPSGPSGWQQQIERDCGSSQEIISDIIVTESNKKYW